MKSLRLVCLALAVLLHSFASADAKPKHRKYFLYVGTYTDKTESKGIYAYRFDTATGELSEAGVAAETPNPSFLVADRAGRYLFAVNEVSKYKGESSGAVTAFAIHGETGELSALNEVSSRGADPCYISLDRNGKHALVANYTGGNIAVFPIGQDGRLGEASAFVQHSGSSVQAGRQDGPHAHWIETTPDQRYAIAADLGLDKLLVYRFDPIKGTLTANQPAFAKVEPGSGPRHVAFHPAGSFAYSVNELKSTITAFSYSASDGTLHAIETVSTLPKGFTGQNDTAEIHVHPSGKFLYASNRGRDSIAVFAIDPKTGKLTPAGDFPTQGKTPRNFEFDPEGKRLVVANQASGTVVVFDLEASTGRLTPTGKVLKVPSPVDLKFVGVD